MSDLILEFTGKSIKEWETWYLETHPDAIEKASEKITKMVDNFKAVISQIDRNMITSWVKDLVIIKTFIGLKFQEAILSKVATIFNTSYKLSIPEDESKGIDGYIGDIPVSIKPETYKAKKSLSDKISNTNIEKFYLTSRKLGVLGGKLLGAGGGGHLLLFSEPNQKPIIMRELEKIGGKIVNFHFNPKGLEVWEIE